MEEKESLYPYVTKNETQILIRIISQLYPYFQSIPVLTGRHDLDRVADIAVTEGHEKDFFWALEFSTRFFAELFYNGFLPIATRLEPFPPRSPSLASQILQIVPSLERSVTSSSGLVVLLPKLHAERCLVEDWKQVHVGKNSRKRAKKYHISFDLDIEQVMKQCVEQHGENWLYPPVQAAFRSIQKTPVELRRKKSKTKAAVDKERPPVRLHSVELWEKATGSLVAGEIGYAVGSVYTSLTGFYTKNSTGMIQMLSMAGVLRTSGYELWDLGMSLPYKIDLGAKNVPRAQFISRLRELRDRCPLKDKHDAKSTNNAGGSRNCSRAGIIHSKKKFDARWAIDSLGRPLDSCTEDDGEAITSGDSKKLAKINITKKEKSNHRKSKGKTMKKVRKAEVEVKSVSKKRPDTSDAQPVKEQDIEVHASSSTGKRPKPDLERHGKTDAKKTISKNMQQSGSSE
mmetsp:Transcript_2437/g.3546  ORF Transcript_2437/g.3546 Transcript_2437/m.3546 type:complete len:457 (+) Transcript_2437:52-1422(+)